MGLDCKIYVGPYLEVRKNTTMKVQACGNKSCPLHGEEAKSNFCPHCGTKMSHVDVPCKGKKVDFDVFDEFSETLTEVVDPNGGIKENYLILIPNDPNMGKHMNARNDADVLSYNEVGVAVEANIFRQKFQTEIEKCIAAFGIPNVVVRWGVIVWQI